jgi:hypothetical protein
MHNLWTQFGLLGAVIVIVLVCDAEVGLPKWKDPIVDRQANQRYWKWRERSDMAFAVIIVGGLGAFLIALSQGWIG